jgi:CoA:oxalate CoA-transferase
MARIIEITDLAGAYATRLLVEAGHEVIRIENPNGDGLRNLPPFFRAPAGIDSSCYHQFLNAGKKSLSLALDNAPGRELFLRLAKTADAVVADDLWPIDAGQLFQANPKLVYTKIVDGDEPEICALARSGLMSLTGQPDGTPMMLGGHLASLAAGTYIAVAIAAALQLVQKSGKGVSATVSLREALESFVEQAMVEYSFSDVVTERRGSKGAITAVSGAMPCQDGHWVISQINRPGRWLKFVEWVQDPQLAAYPSLAEEANQMKQRDFILERVYQWANSHTKNELVEEAQRRHFPASPVSTTLDLINDPQLIERGYLKPLDHPQLGQVLAPQGAIATMQGRNMKAAPRLGEHNIEIFDELGLSQAQREALKTAADFDVKPQ